MIKLAKQSVIVVATVVIMLGATMIKLEDGNMSTVQKYSAAPVVVEQDTPMIGEDGDNLYNEETSTIIEDVELQ